jgi:hypothetical protein
MAIASIFTTLPLRQKTEIEQPILQLKNRELPLMEESGSPVGFAL